MIEIEKIETETQRVRPPRPDNYLVWAILSTVLCCLITGIVSIVYSTKVDTAYTDGDYEGALRYANKAKTWAIIGAISGFAGVVIYIIILVIATVISR